MNGQLFAAGMAVLLLFLGGATTLITLALRPPGLPSIEPTPPPPARRPVRRRKAAEMVNERLLITAALRGGIDPAWLARRLRGPAAINRRRIARVRRLMQAQAVAVVKQQSLEMEALGHIQHRDK